MMQEDILFTEGDTLQSPERGHSVKIPAPQGGKKGGKVLPGTLCPVPPLSNKRVVFFLVFFRLATRNSNQPWGMRMIRLLCGTTTNCLLWDSGLSIFIAKASYCRKKVSDASVTVLATLTMRTMAD